MKKLMLAVMLAMMLVAAPALAQSVPVGPHISDSGPPNEEPAADAPTGGPPGDATSPPDEELGADAPASGPPDESPRTLPNDPVQIAPADGPSSNDPGTDSPPGRPSDEAPGIDTPAGGPPGGGSGADTLASGPSDEGPGADTPASRPPDGGPETTSIPVDPDTPISGATDRGPETLLNCDVLKAIGCDIPRLLELVGGQDAGAENLGPEGRDKKANKDDPAPKIWGKKVDGGHRRLGDEEAGGDPEQVSDQEADSGNVDQSTNISNTGDNVNMCLGVLQAANTGNSLNQQGVLQDNSEADRIELTGGGSITITPQLVVDCRQVILQVAAAAQQSEQRGERQANRQRSARSVPEAVGLKHVAPAAAKAGSGAVIGQPMVVRQSASALKGLPRTGGISGSYAAFLGLGAGSLLITTGLFARRVFW